MRAAIIVLALAVGIAAGFMFCLRPERVTGKVPYSIGEMYANPASISAARRAVAMCKSQPTCRRSAEDTYDAIAREIERGGQ